MKDWPLPLELSQNKNNPCSYLCQIIQIGNLSINLKLNIEYERIN